MHFVANIRRYYDILTWVTQPQLEGSQVADGNLHVPGVDKTQPPVPPASPVPSSSSTDESAL